MGNVGYAQAVGRAALVPLGWVFGAPILGYIAYHLGRRKPVIFAGAALMLAATAAVLSLPRQTFSSVCSALTLFLRRPDQPSGGRGHPCM